MGWLTADSRRHARGRMRLAFGSVAALCLCASGIPLVAALGAASPAGAATPSGTLYEVDYTTSSALNAFPTTASGSSSPSARNTSSALTWSADAVFDSAGDLWVANLGEASGTGSATPSITEFTPGQLTSTGSPTPTVTIT
ncbi:MAG TPA: hypothetical protein VEG62_03920, partial [Acidimicrobiales bacterium]|nr:hypothetical protein [Acidimicrobiales bacterium]